MYKVLRKFNTLQFFFLLKLLIMSNFYSFTKFWPKNILIHTTAWFVFPVQAYFPKYFTMCVICKMYDTCSMLTMIFPFLWDSVLITIAIAAMIVCQLDIDSDFFFRFIHDLSIVLFLLIHVCSLCGFILHESAKQNFCWNTTWTVTIFYKDFCLLLSPTHFHIILLCFTCCEQFLGRQDKLIIIKHTIQ